MTEAIPHFPNEPRLSYADNQSAALKNANALVVVTEWKKFRSPDFDLFLFVHEITEVVPRALVWQRQVLN